MTGSGKTGLLTVMVEEALRERVPVLMIDVKGDIPNLLLAFPGFESRSVEPWVEASPGDERSVAEIAAALATEREVGLRAWGIGEPELSRFHRETEFTVITPGSSAGVPLHLLSSLERPAAAWEESPDAGGHLGHRSLAHTPRGANPSGDSERGSPGR
jgi:hypothetical protein